MITQLIQYLKSFFEKPLPPPRVVEHRGMKGYFTSEMIAEFEEAKVDYVQLFREAVDETLEEDQEVDEENPYK